KAYCAEIAPRRSPSNIAYNGPVIGEALGTNIVINATINPPIALPKIRGIIFPSFTYKFQEKAALPNNKTSNISDFRTTPSNVIVLFNDALSTFRNVDLRKLGLPLLNITLVHFYDFLLSCIYCHISLILLYLLLMTYLIFIYNI